MNNNYMLPQVFISNYHKKLDKVIKIIVPSTINVNEPINTDSQVNDCLTFLTNVFGGATAEKAMGAWKSLSGEIVKEDVTICYSFTDRETQERNFISVLMYCDKLKKELNQEPVSLIADNELHFI